MKGAALNGLRGRQLFLTLVAFICTTTLIWAWGRSPLLVWHQEFLRSIPPAVTLVDNNPLDVPVGEGAGGSGAARAGDVAPSESPVEDGHARSSHLPAEDCNHAKGEWVSDRRRPLYSGFECKQWLSAMWACRLTDRPDFSFESFSWKPKGCKVPEFDGPTFLERMRDKTIAFVGDSLGRQQFQSLMCMVTDGKMDLEVKDVGIEYGLVKALDALRPDGWVYRFPRTNTTILYYWSATLCELVPLDVNNATTGIAMHLDRPTKFLQQYINRFDILVLNTGHHWNRGKLNANRWKMYVQGEPLQHRKLAVIDNAKNFTIYSVAKWVDFQLGKYPHLKAFFRTLSPRHFLNGDWNTGGSCNNTIPLAHGRQVLQEGSSDPVVEGALKGTRVKILDITALSQLRDEGHISRYSPKGLTGIHDCLHWCLPGIPDAWNEILCAQL